MIYFLRVLTYPEHQFELLDFSTFLKERLIKLNWLTAVELK